MTLLAILLGARRCRRWERTCRTPSSPAPPRATTPASRLARTEAIRRNVRDRVRPHRHARCRRRTSPTRSAPPSNGRNWVVRAASRRRPSAAVEAKAGAEGEGSAGRRRRSRSSARPRRQRCSTARIPFNGFGAHRPSGGARTRSTSRNPDRGHVPRAGGKIRCRRITVSPGGQVAVLRSWPLRPETAVRAERPRAVRQSQARLLPHRGDGRDPDLRARHPRPGRHGRHRRVVAVRRAVPHRGEQPGRCDRRPDRPRHQPDHEATKAASLAAFAHQPSPAPPTAASAPSCAFSGAAAHAGGAHRGMPRC